MQIFWFRWASGVNEWSNCALSDTAVVKYVQPTATEENTLEESASGFSGARGCSSCFLLYRSPPSYLYDRCVDVTLIVVEEWSEDLRDALDTRKNALSFTLEPLPENFLEACLLAYFLLYISSIWTCETWVLLGCASSRRFFDVPELWYI